MDIKIAALQATAMAKKVFEKLKMDEKADAGIFKLIIGVFLIAILVGALIPTAITAIMGANQTNWDAGTTATYNAIPILIVVVVIAVLAGLAYKAFND